MGKGKQPWVGVGMGVLGAASGHLWEPPGPLAQLTLPRCVQRVLLVLLKRVQEIYHCSPDCKITDRGFMPLLIWSFYINSYVTPIVDINGSLMEPQD